jgi:hypothetical protein
LRHDRVLTGTCVQHELNAVASVRSAHRTCCLRLFIFPHRIPSPLFFIIQAVEENANESEEELGSEEEEDGASASAAKPKPAAKRTAGGSKLKGAARGKK